MEFHFKTNFLRLFRLELRLIGNRKKSHQGESFPSPFLPKRVIFALIPFKQRFSPCNLKVSQGVNKSRIFRNMDVVWVRRRGGVSPYKILLTTRAPSFLREYNNERKLHLMWHGNATICSLQLRISVETIKIVIGHRKKWIGTNSFPSLSPPKSASFTHSVSF